MNFRMRVWIVVFGLVIASSAMAHEDLDIGIAEVVLDKKCRASITLKNYGRDLPESFYMTVRPAFFMIKKGSQLEESKSLRSLDKKRALQKNGGVLTVRSKKDFTDNPKPMDINMQFGEEFLDYGAANNRFLASMDCKKGIGQVAGEKIPQTQPDIAVKTARITPEQCQIQVTFVNLSPIGLSDDAWLESSGSFLMQLSLPSHERQANTPLQVLDPSHQFTRSLNELHYSAPLPKTTAETWKIGLWRVKNEKDFSNNEIEISVPEPCRVGEDQ